MNLEASPRDKKEWRRTLSQLRESLTAEQRAARSNLLCRLMEEQVLAPLRRQLGRPLAICGYAAFRSEADPSELLARCLAEGDLVLAPRIAEDGSGMELRRIRSLQGDWSPGRWGVPEPDPARTERVPIQVPIDVILVPGLAFDRAGGRLGYGGGYYDRLYAARRSVADGGSTQWYGFAFAVQLVREALPIEPHDLKLDGVATDEGSIGFASGGIEDVQ